MAPGRRVITGQVVSTGKEGRRDGGRKDGKEGRREGGRVRLKHKK